MFAKKVFNPRGWTGRLQHVVPLPSEDGSSHTACLHSLLPGLGLISPMDGFAKHLPEPLENDGVCKKLEKLSKSMQVTLPNSLPLSQGFHSKMKARPCCSEGQKSLLARGPGRAAGELGEVLCTEMGTMGRGAVRLGGSHAAPTAHRDARGAHTANMVGSKPKGLLPQRKRGERPPSPACFPPF